MRSSRAKLKEFSNQGCFVTTTLPTNDLLHTIFCDVTLVKESTIEAYALRTGLIKEGQEMTELQKVLARYGTIMEATTKSQGDMLRTINESANVFRGLWSQVKLVAISFGDALLPAVTKVAKQMRDWLSANQQKAAELFVDVIEDITLGIARFAEEIIEHVCKIIANHHSAKDIDTLEFRCVWDADWIVNIQEDFKQASREQLRETIDRVFKTNTGYRMAMEILLENDVVKP